MKTTMKRPNAEMLVKIETMLNEFAKIRTIASKLDTQVVTVYRYANHLGYKNVMVSNEEMELIVNHRAKRIKDEIRVTKVHTTVESTPATTAPATPSATPAAVEPTVQALD